MLKLNTSTSILTLMMKQVWVCFLLLEAFLGSNSGRLSHRKAGPAAAGGPPTQVKTKTPKT